MYVLDLVGNGNNTEAECNTDTSALNQLYWKVMSVSFFYQRSQISNIFLLVGAQLDDVFAINYR